MAKRKPDLYKMKLHEILITDECKPGDGMFTTVMRVPGGWIYRSWDKGNNLATSTFVPFDTEFLHSMGGNYGDYD